MIYLLFKLIRKCLKQTANAILWFVGIRDKKYIQPMYRDSHLFENRTMKDLTIILLLLVGICSVLLFVHFKLK